MQSSIDDFNRLAPECYVVFQNHPHLPHAWFMAFCKIDLNLILKELRGEVLLERTSMAPSVSLATVWQSYQEFKTNGMLILNKDKHRRFDFVLKDCVLKRFELYMGDTLQASAMDLEPKASAHTIIEFSDYLRHTDSKFTKNFVIYPEK